VGFCVSNVELLDSNIRQFLMIYNVHQILNYLQNEQFMSLVLGKNSLVNFLSIMT
jgi:hypothetical protein